MRKRANKACIPTLGTPELLQSARWRHSNCDREILCPSGHEHGGAMVREKGGTTQLGPARVMKALIRGGSYTVHRLKMIVNIS